MYWPIEYLKVNSLQILFFLEATNKHEAIFGILFYGEGM